MLTIQKKNNKNPSIEEGQTIQWPKENGRKDKQWSTKHHTEKQSLSNKNPTKNRWWIRVFRKGMQFLLQHLASNTLIRNKRF